MKHLLLAISMVALAGGAYAQSAAQSLSGSASQSASGAAAQGNSITYNEAARPSRITNRSEGTTTVKTTGIAAAPGLALAGHPCLSGGSLSLGIVGYAAGGAFTTPETTCMLAFLGMRDAAIYALATKDRDACRAMVATGKIQSDCGRTVRRKNKEVAPAVATSGTTGQWSKCSFDKAANKITWKPRGNRAASKAACIASLGF